MTRLSLDTGSPSAAAAETLLVDAARTLPLLEGVMERVGARLPPDQFIACVARAYQLVKYFGHREDTAARFQQGGGHTVFLESLRTAVEQTEHPLNILVVGCGPGFAGLTSSYAVEAIEGSIPSAAIGQLVRREVSPRQIRHWASSGSLGVARVDLLVSHSLLHFVPNPAPLLTLLKGAVRPGGHYIMAHEPNARYWQNAVCQQALADFETSSQMHRRSEKWRRLRRLASAVKRLVLGSRGPRNLTRDVQLLLQRRLGLRNELRPVELSRIVDPHRRGSRASEFALGWDGFDWDHLANVCLSEWKLVWQRTYDHLGYIPTAAVSESLRSRTSALRETYPNDGMVFTMIWKRNIDVRQDEAWS